MASPVKHDKLPLLIVFIAVIAFLAPGYAAAGKTLRLATTEYPTYYGKNLENQGVISEIIQEAFKAAGYDVTLTFLPWKRALDMTQYGDFNALYTAWYRKEREAWFAFSDPLPIRNPLGFYKRRNQNISYRTIEDLKPYTIGIVRGYSNPPEFTRGNLKTEEVTEDRLNLHKLVIGRIDLALIDRIIGRHIIETELPDSEKDLEWLDPPLKLEKQYVMFSKKIPGYEKTLADFNRGLKEIIDSGLAGNIITRHGFR